MGSDKLRGQRRLIHEPEAEMFSPSRLVNGRFEILNFVGIGGMGQVYRARDVALGRIVALKFLRDVSHDIEFERRLQHEASVISRLNHPNICTLYDLAQEAGLDFLVMEFLEGETLENKLKKGPLPETQAVRLAQQIAAGLEHAHQHGITHRDLKPSNFMLTETGLKILDFGLAKIRPKVNPSGAIGDADFNITQTQPGRITGTPAYMAPEQVRGEPADERSDIFGFGAIVYEMLSGRRPFTGASIQEVFAAILTSAPQPIATEHLNPIVERIIFRCLEKDPEQRFQHASELRFPLELAATAAGVVEGGTQTPVRRRPWLWAGVIGLCLLALLIARLALWSSKPEQAFTFHQVTFRRGSIDKARFAWGGQTIVYDAAWEGKPSDIFESQLQTPEARALGFPNSYLASVAGSGELMILQVHRSASTRPFFDTGTLARVAATGGSPREILDNVYAADSSPDATAVAAMQLEGSTLTVQYPLGSVLCKIPLDYEPKFRLSTDGQILAVTRHAGEQPYISLFRKDSRNPSAVAEGYWIRSLAWISPRELVFSGYRSGEDDFGLFVTAIEGKPRLLTRFPYDFQIQDVWKKQRFLLKVHHEQSLAIFRGSNGTDLNLSWLDHSHLNGLSADGSAFLTSEVGQGGGDLGSVYLRKTDGSPATRLCSGIGIAISPDAKWVLARPRPTGYELVPTGAGRSYPLQFPSGASLDTAKWFPDGNHIALTLQTEQGWECYVQDLHDGTPSGTPHRIASLNLPCGAVSPDGRYVVTHSDGQTLRTYPLTGRASVPLPGVVSEERALSFSADGRYLYVASFQQTPARASVFRIEIATGHRERRAEISPADPSGVPKIDSIFITPNGKQLAYSFHRVLNDLFVADVH